MTAVTAHYHHHHVKEAITIIIHFSDDEVAAWAILKTNEATRKTKLNTVTFDVSVIVVLSLMRAHYSFRLRSPLRKSRP